MQATQGGADTALMSAQRCLCTSLRAWSAAPQQVRVDGVRVQQTRATSDILRALLRLLPAGVQLLAAVRRLHATRLAAGAQRERRLCVRRVTSFADASLVQRRCAGLGLRAATVSCKRTRHLCAYLARGASAVHVDAVAAAA